MKITLFTVITFLEIPVLLNSFNEAYFRSGFLSAYTLNRNLPGQLGSNVEGIMQYLPCFKVRREN